MNTDPFSDTTTNHSAGTNQAWSNPVTGLRRVSNGRMIGGVAAGIGRAINVNPLLVRIGFVVATLWFDGLPIAIYAALWVLLGNDTDPVCPLQRWLSSANSGYVAPQPKAPAAPQHNPWQYSGPMPAAAPTAPPAPSGPDHQVTPSEATDEDR